MLGGGVAALGTGAAVPLTYYTGNLREQPPPEFHVVEKADFDLAPGTSNIIRYGETRIPILILRTPPPEKELRVFVATCTHFDCNVGYREEKNVNIVCPCHEGHFDLDGNVVSGPPPAPLQRLPHRLKDDKLVIALEKENLEKAF